MYVDQATLWYFEAHTDLSILYLNLQIPVLSDSQPKIFFMHTLQPVIKAAGYHISITPQQQHNNRLCA